jgi:general secretion pathway protein D
MLVLGGLIDEDVQVTQSRVPVLGSIPLLGRLFRYDKTTKLKRTLMVFIHPTIINDPSQGHLISQSKYTYLRGQQDQLSGEAKLEVTPELDEFPDAPTDLEQDDADSESNPDGLPDDENR